MTAIQLKDAVDINIFAELNCLQTEAALLKLLHYLQQIDYHFVTPTPATHARVIHRQPRAGSSAADILGWNLSFASGSIDPILEQGLAEAGMLEEDGHGNLRSLIRVSSLHDELFIHSAYPTTAPDAVFFGPDSYRFADLIGAELADLSLDHRHVITDMGTGAGVGAIVAAGLFPQAQIVVTDLNPKALTFARINARYAGRVIEMRLGRDLAGHSGGGDVVIANPPYIFSDGGGCTYRDGGAMLGAEVSLTMARAALSALRPGGRFILYTGSAIVSGTDFLKKELETLASGHQFSMRYRELDPDVFGEELDKVGYETVDRICVVAAIFQAPG